MRAPSVSIVSPPFSRPVRIFGPARSCSRATARPRRSAISRAAFMTARCSSGAPWEKFSRTTSTPASIRASRVRGSRDAGPMVATILVRRMDQSIAGPPGARQAGGTLLGGGTMANKPFLSDVKTLRERARKHIEQGAVTPGYGADRETVVRILNEALATEIVCVLRYKRHYFMASGI